MKKIILLFITTFLLVEFSNAQSRAYTAKGGLTIGNQIWESQEQQPLFSYHGAFAMESASEESNLGLFMQLGYHVKGSAWRNTRFTSQTGGVSFSSQKFKYQNLALVLGFKSFYSENNMGRLYYSIGLRGDYTIGTNLKDYEEFNLINGAPIFPVEGAVNKWNYGMTLGAGIQIPMTDFIDGIVELSFSPDFSQQYRQPSFASNVIINGSPQLRTFPERKIVNLVLELSVGLRFLHKIEYVD